MQLCLHAVPVDILVTLHLTRSATWWGYGRHHLLEVAQHFDKRRAKKVQSSQFPSEDCITPLPLLAHLLKSQPRQDCHGLQESSKVSALRLWQEV